MKRLCGTLLVATALALSSSCIRSTRVEVRRTGETRDVDVTRRWHGLTVGPCGLAGGGHAHYSMRLDGPGPVFPAEKVAFLDESGRVDESAREGLTGEVRIDSARRRITIDLNRGKYQLEVNGSYGYREP